MSIGKEIFTKDTIQVAVKEIASKLPTGNDVIFLGVLDGCIPFLSDLMKNIGGELVVKTVKANSYTGTKRSDSVKFNFNFDLTLLVNKRVVIIDDILDSGNTITDLTTKIANYTLDIRWCCLLKRELSEKKLLVDGFLTVPQESFVIGYGLDYEGLYRNLNSICEWKVDGLH